MNDIEWADRVMCLLAILIAEQYDTITLSDDIFEEVKELYHMGTTEEDDHNE